MLTLPLLTRDSPLKIKQIIKKMHGVLAHGIQAKSCIFEDTGFRETVGILRY